MQELNCPPFDDTLWEKAQKAIHGGNCHKLANVMTTYITAHKIMAKFGVTEHILSIFNHSAKELISIVCAMERQTRDQMVENIKRDLCWS